MNRINIITLGVRNMKKALLFYRDGMGFETKVESNNPNVVFFNSSGTKLSLYPIDLLIEDISPNKSLSLADGFCGLTLAYNTKSKEEVFTVIESARKAGAIILKEPQKVFCGGFHAYFKDLDGYFWEVAYGPDFIYDENDMLQL